MFSKILKSIKGDRIKSKVKNKIKGEIKKTESTSEDKILEYESPDYKEECNLNEDLIDMNIKEDEVSFYIKKIKIKREKSIKAINLYTSEEKYFDTYKECSKKLEIPIGYIKENLLYGNIDYLGEAISYLSKEFNIKECKDDKLWYLDSKKTPIELFNYLNNKIFSSNISKKKREEILSSEKIDSIRMNYKFECIDEEYDDYFKLYGAIIKRGGKKKVELVRKNGEVIRVFKSTDECAEYFKKEKSEIVDKLKCGDVNIGRYSIRYCLRKI